MLKVSSSLPDIAVLRGGSKAFKESLENGGEVLSSLKKIGYTPLDILIEKDGSWTLAGFPTDPHTIFTRAHTIIDTTRLEDQPYQALAKRMGVHIYFSVMPDISHDRESLYRLLRQKNIDVPNSKIIRASQPLKPEIFRTIWTSFHTPILIRPIKRHDTYPSKIIKMFTEFEEAVRDYHEHGIDVHVLTYKAKIPVTSLAVLPHFRNEEIYTPLWVDVFPEDSLPNTSSRMSPHLQAPDFKKEHIKEFAKKIYSAVGVSSPMCIDFINHNNKMIVVNVDLYPNLRKDGRFLKSLATTGIDIGQYIHGCILNDLKR